MDGLELSEQAPFSCEYSHDPSLTSSTLACHNTLPVVSTSQQPNLVDERFGEQVLEGELLQNNVSNDYFGNMFEMGQHIQQAAMNLAGLPDIINTTNTAINTSDKVLKAVGKFADAAGDVAEIVTNKTVELYASTVNTTVAMLGVVEQGLSILEQGLKRIATAIAR